MLAAVVLVKYLSSKSLLFKVERAANLMNHSITSVFSFSNQQPALTWTTRQNYKWMQIDYKSKL